MCHGCNPHPPKKRDREKTAASLGGKEGTLASCEGTHSPTDRLQSQVSWATDAPVEDTHQEQSRAGQELGAVRLPTGSKWGGAVASSPARSSLGAALLASASGASASPRYHRPKKLRILDSGGGGGGWSPLSLESRSQEPSSSSLLSASSGVPNILALIFFRCFLTATFMASSRSPGIRWSVSSSRWK